LSIRYQKLGQQQKEELEVLLWTKALQAPLTRLGEYTQLARHYGFNVSSTISILLLAD